jgi:hypothetical protein
MTGTLGYLQPFWSESVNLAAIHCVVLKSVANFRTLMPWDRSNFIFSISVTGIFAELDARCVFLSAGPAPFQL